jgi:hypothetical protein
MKMVGFPSHFAIGLILSLPFVTADRRNRYKTLLFGGAAAAAPDFDSPALIWDLSFFGIEHRGFIHSFELWFGLTFLFVLVIIFTAYDKYKRADSSKLSDYVFDKTLYLGVMLIGWFSHLVMDFGLTDFHAKAWFYTMTGREVWYLDNILGLVTALILGSIIWFEVKERKKTAETVLSHHRELRISPQATQEKFSPLQMILPQIRKQSYQKVVPVSQVGSPLGIENDEEIKELLKDHMKSLQDSKKKSDYCLNDEKGEIIFKSFLEKFFGRTITDLPSMALVGAIILSVEVVLSILLTVLIGTVIIITPDSW